MAQVTSHDIRALLTSRVSDPILVEWLDEDLAVTDTVEVIARELLGNISYCNRERSYRILASAEDLRQMGDWDVEHPTDDDFAAFAQMVNEG